MLLSPPRGLDVGLCRRRSFAALPHAGSSGQAPVPQRARRASAVAAPGVGLAAPRNLDYTVWRPTCSNSGVAPMGHKSCQAASVGRGSPDRQRAPRISVGSAMATQRGSADTSEARQMGTSGGSVQVPLRERVPTVGPDGSWNWFSVRGLANGQPRPKPKIVVGKTRAQVDIVPRRREIDRPPPLLKSPAFSPLWRRRLARALGSAVKAIDNAAIILKADCALGSVLAGSPCKGLGSSILAFIGVTSGAHALACCGRAQKELVLEILEPLDSSLRMIKARRAQATMAHEKSVQFEQNLDLDGPDKQALLLKNVAQTGGAPTSASAAHGADTSKPDCVDKEFPMRLRRRSAPPAVYAAPKVPSAAKHTDAQGASLRLRAMATPCRKRHNVPIMAAPLVGKARSAALGRELLRVLLCFSSNEGVAGVTVATNA